MNPSTKLLFCIGEISGLFLDEAEAAEPEKTTHKRVAKYGALAAAALGIAAVTYRVIRAKRNLPKSA
jgi:hypothetical protein